MILPNTVAYGTTYTADEEAYRYVREALEAGYRIINTCAAYGNEKGMGRAISDVSREELMIISLDRNSRRSSKNSACFDGYQAEMDQIYETLENLGVSYIDCYMINWPVPRYMEDVWEKLNADSWRAMEDCLKKGLIRHLGVSNFLPGHLETLRETARLPVEITQMEIHPSFQQREAVEYCKNQGIEVMAWSPLFKGRSVTLPAIAALAEKYGKTPAQIILRWDIQKKIIPVISSTNSVRMKSNLDIFDFELEKEDMARIDDLETGEHVDAFSYKRQQKSLKNI